jgi:hypothetical protein
MDANGRDGIGLGAVLMKEKDMTERTIPTTVTFRIPPDEDGDGEGTITFLMDPGACPDDPAE